jgi:hypothetical protein
MTSFAQAVLAQDALTTNGAAAFQSTLNANVDLFFKIGAMRGQDPVPAFVKAYVEDSDVALRIVQWVRDVRGGAGERELFRKVLAYLENSDVAVASKLIKQIPEIGRWDDLLVLTKDSLKQEAFGLIKNGLEAQNGLCAKWMPRKGKVAEELRAFLGFTPKRYRKTLVTLTNVVETPMCAKQFDTIEFGKIPSLAAARYKKAFVRNAPVAYAAYADALTKGEAKINAGAIFPYDVLKGVSMYSDATERDVALAQWDALPNYVGEASILPMVDVSGSMTTYKAGGSGSVTCMDVAMSLGLYLAEKNTGAFKDTFMTFTDQPELYNLRGNVFEKQAQMSKHVGYSTNLQAAFTRLLTVAVKNQVSQADMPEVLLILSDMQFDCMGANVTALDMIRKEYIAQGYVPPKVVFWNLNDRGNVPTRFDESGAALVSGFSPAIVKTVLKAENFDPRSIMLDAVMITRYDLK